MMRLWAMLTSNYYINIGVIAWFIAQVLKTLLTLINTKQLVLERFVGAGGMPSAHSAFTISIAVAMARKLGYSSPEFALAIAFAMIVMYDAMGVRRAAGEQAKVLNKMLFEFSDFPWFLKMDKETIKKEFESSEIEHLSIEATAKSEEDAQPLAEKELQEFIGHTPLEVVGGCILGTIVALLMPVK